jgi:hypothetical protein
MDLRQPITLIFQDRIVPKGSKLAGWGLIVVNLEIPAPVRRSTCISDQHVRGSRREEAGWNVFDKRYWPGETFAEHLVFALRHESIDLLLLKRIFAAAPKFEIAAEIESMVRKTPTGVFVRRAWFLYELLTGRTLGVHDLGNVAATDVLDPAIYFTGKPRMSRRHRVRDNLLGNGNFCPVIRRTKKLQELVGLDLGTKAKETVGRTGANLVARAAGFLLLADSRASFEIEGERPPRSRLERWGRAVAQAGRYPLTLNEIIRLHQVLIEDTRFVQHGLRPDGVFLGERDPVGDPLPEFIGARTGDLNSLLTGLLEANDRMSRDEVDPVLKAAATAFGFIYIHPFQDGNGRMHRCLIHHVLAERRFTPPGMLFPVSSVMLDHIDEYRATLQAHSGPLMPFVEWRVTPDHNVDVLNDTADLYRYFDCTEAAEFLYACVRRTIEHDLPRELEYLARHDEAVRRIMDEVEMPDRIAEDLVIFIRQNNGGLPKKRREKEFVALKDGEVSVIERIVCVAFEGF